MLRIQEAKLLIVKEKLCKSILNKSGITDYCLNCYTGCQHGCVYCLDGETLILMYDGTTKFLKNLKVGDKIYGVRKSKNTGYYYYKITEVLAYWKTFKPAIKIVMENGIEVICSPGHRWFSTRGWKYTIGQMSDLLRRPYLTENNLLHGVGKLTKELKETGKRKIVLGGKQVKESFKVKKIIDLREIREMYDITTGTGTFIANGLVSHNCYARFMKRFTNHHEPWGEFVDVKINAASVLKNEIKRKPKGEVFISSVCDPYQPIEEKYQLTRKCLKILIENKFPITILTKSSLAKRDFDILRDYPRVELGLTITTLNENLRKRIEPRSASSQERLAALKEASLLGIKTYCFLGPFLPFIGDREESLRELFGALTSLDLIHILVDRLNLRFGVWQSLLPVLSKHYPQTIPQIRKVLFDKKESQRYSYQLHRQVENIVRSLGLAEKIRFCF